MTLDFSEKVWWLCGMMSHIMCKFTKIKVSVVTKKKSPHQNRDMILVLVAEANSVIWHLDGFVRIVRVNYLYSVTLNFTTQTMLLNGSSYNIYIYYEGWLLLSVYVVHALISLLWHFWPHAGCAIRGASAIYMGLTWVQGHGYLHGIADILAQSLFSRKPW